jgi:hypothetical protein
MLLYRNVLHPEFFGIEGRRVIEHGDYEFEAWIFRGGHALRFQHEGVCLNEIVTDQLEHMPERGLVGSFPCAGERDHEQAFGDQLLYVTSIQTEVLSDHLYLGTHKEMLEHGREDGLMSMWIEDGGGGKPSLSLLDMQRFADQVHIQSYHLRSDCGLVLRTQTIFQVKDLKDAAAPGRKELHDPTAAQPTGQLIVRRSDTASKGRPSQPA